MISFLFTTRDGAEHRIEAAEGASLMEATRNAGFDDLQAICGGCAACATCHVYIEAAPDGSQIPAIAEGEDELLDGLYYRRENSRLSCQIPAHASLDGLKITAAPEE